ncbi:MAG: deoxyribonuclease IV [Ignavibacteriales bacterium]|nr:deoxyribonuclease IV [Ignavibacteriales bacterium]
MSKSTNHKILLGAHMSIAGGVHTAVDRATSIGCTALQVFTKNNNQWSGKPFSESDIAQYKEKITAAGIAPVVSHDSYLINLCGTNPDVLKKSRAAFIDELERCEQLGIPLLNFHPGSHLGAGDDEGIKLICESLNLAHDITKNYKVKSVLEATAGQGTNVGYKFEHLRAIIDGVEDPERMAVCIDTCHVFAAGYDIATEKGYEETFKQFDEIVGLDRLVAFHINDSKKGLGSHVDRHEHIGKGAIGLTGFRLLMNDERFTHIPKILETPKSEDLHEDVENMRVLKSLIQT